MKPHQVVEEISREQLKQDLPSFQVGDTLDVHFRLRDVDAKGKVKERLQLFSGVVIARKGRGIHETISLYRIAHGHSMERLFLLHSPMVASIKKVRSGRVRRAKLYYLRGKQGRAAQVKGMRGN
ncbi:MAG: 50S ribosomal protein L19 [Chlamydiota bacterium]|nr:50S ribosomal protein L19 [Chlamydiota bacterium]